MDYEQLLASVKQQRTSGHDQLQRVKKLSKTSKLSKDSALLKTHHEAWDRMHTQVVSAKVNSQVGVEMWKSKVLGSRDEELKAFVLECTDYESQLYEERLEFETNTVDPIWSLRIDLKSWIQESSCPEEDRPVLDHEGVLKELKSIKKEQNRIQELLEAEYDMVQSELDRFASECLPSESNGQMFSRGIPQEALDLECPDPELKELALQEFVVVDNHYLSLLNQLDQSNKEILRYNVLQKCMKVIIHFLLSSLSLSLTLSLPLPLNTF